MIFNKTIKVQYYKKTLNDPDVAKDVVQKVMKYIWENSDKLRDNSPIAPYVYTAVRHKILSYIEHRNHKTNTLLH